MIEPIDTAPKDGARILCLCADGRTQYCWWVGCSEFEGFWMTEREATPRAWYVGTSLPPEDPAVAPAADARGPGSVADIVNATDEELSDLYEDAGGVMSVAFRAIYNLGREHGAAASARRPVQTSLKELALAELDAAVLRVVAEWLERRWPQGPDMHPCACAAWLRAEADRAEAGEVGNG